jgi:hypothetical protein
MLLYSPAIHHHSVLLTLKLSEFPISPQWGTEFFIKVLFEFSDKK